MLRLILCYLYGLCPRIERHLLPLAVAVSDMFGLIGMKTLVQQQIRMLYCHSFHKVIFTLVLNSIGEFFYNYSNNVFIL